MIPLRSQILETEGIPAGAMPFYRGPPPVDSQACQMLDVVAVAEIYARRLEFIPVGWLCEAASLLRQLARALKRARENPRAGWQA